MNTLPTATARKRPSGNIQLHVGDKLVETLPYYRSNLPTRQTRIYPVNGVNHALKWRAE